MNELRLEQVTEALFSSLDLHDVLSNVRAPLVEILGADRSALCITKPSRSMEYDWFTVDMPRSFFSAYPEIASVDFVRQSVIARPNHVLTDADMVQGPVEETPVYELASAHGLKLRHVMSVLLTNEPGWHGGVTLYREGGRAFSDEERALLTRLTAQFRLAIRSCRAYREESISRRLAERLTECAPGAGAILLEPSGIEFARTHRVTGIFERWFPAVEGRRQGVPDRILRRLQGVAHAAAQGAPSRFVRRGDEASLFASIEVFPVAPAAEPLWCVVLEERETALLVPPAWRGKLTAAERDVLRLALRGMDNQLISELRGSAAATVKVHLRRIFDKLGIENRLQLMTRALDAHFGAWDDGGIPEL